MVVDRVKDVLLFKDGAFGEIASDPNGVLQGLVAAAIAALAASFWPALFTFFFAPVVGFLAVTVLLIAIAILAGGCSLVARLYSQTVPPPPYTAWLSTLLFATAPIALGIIPFVGHSAGAVYSLILAVVAIQAVGNLPTAPAMVVLVLGSIAPLVLILLVVPVLGAFAGLGGLLGLIGLS